MEDVKIGVIGAGAIGGAVIDRLVNGTNTIPENIITCDVDDSKCIHIAEQFGVRVTSKFIDVSEADLIILAVPPLVITAALSAIFDQLTHKPLIVSFAAAVPLAKLEASLPKDVPVLRVNPNSPSLVGEGFNPIAYGSGFTSNARSLADNFLSVLGTSIEVPDDMMNLYTALTAVGPTYFLPVFDAIISLGIEEGLSREASIAAACETARGTAKLVENRPETPDQLKLYTGLRPLDDAEVRRLVKAAADDAFARMVGIQEKVNAT